MNRFLLALTFLTRIPVPINIQFDEDEFNKSILTYPWIGMILGGILVGVHWVLHALQVPLPVISLFVLIIYVYLTGGLHLDGLSDTVDGMFSGRKKDRILEIMKDSRLGAFGAIGLILYFLSMITMLPYTYGLVLFLLPVVGRSSILLSAGVSDYAREGGFGKGVIGYANWKHSIYGMMICFILGGLIAYETIISMGITFICIYGITKHIERKLEGITGDILGMVVELSQCLFLFFYIITASILL